MIDRKKAFTMENLSLVRIEHTLEARQILAHMNTEIQFTGYLDIDIIIQVYLFQEMVQKMYP